MVKLQIPYTHLSPKVRIFLSTKELDVSSVAIYFHVPLAQLYAERYTSSFLYLRNWSSRRELLL
jgi:hypothetical protein